MTPSVSTARSWHLLGMTAGVAQHVWREGVADVGPPRIVESNARVSWSKHTLLS